MRLLRVIFYWFWVVSITPGLPAAEPSVPRVSVSFTVVGWGEETRDVAYYQNGKPTKLLIPEVGRSKPYTYAGPQTMSLVRMPAASPDAATATAKDAPPPVPLATVTFDPAVKRNTVLLLKTGSRVEAFLFSDDEAGFPFGQAMLVNLTPTRLAIRCNAKDIVTLAPRERRLAPGGRAELELDAEVAQERAGQWKRVGRSFLPILPDDQTLVLFLPGEGRDGRIRYVILRQKKPKDEKPAPVVQG
ncbi:MAG TPA: hypothetical protein VIO38_04825 [Rariglobus sp.]